MTLKLNGSSAGSVSIDAPADSSPTGTDVTLTLPTSAGSSGQYLQTNGSGTLSWQDPGKILQVVNVQYSPNTATTSTSYVDTGLTSTITPSSSSNKVLVIVSQTLSAVSSGTSTYGRFQLLRDSSSIYSDQRTDMYAQYSHNTYTISILDSPASTSAITYKTQFATGNSSYSYEAQHANLRTSTITLMEVEA